MRIIEFCGAPGVGKSTLAYAVLEKIKQGKTVITRDELVYESCSHFKRIFELIRGSFSDIPLTISVVRFMSAYGINKTRLQYSARLVRFCYLTRKAIKTHASIIFLDEGIIQHITSIPHDNLIKDDDNFKVLCARISEIMKDFVIVSCELDELKTFERLKKRNSKGTRISKMSVDEQKKMISVRNKNIDLLVEYINTKGVILADTSMPTDVLSDNLIAKINYMLSSGRRIKCEVEKH